MDHAIYQCKMICVADKNFNIVYINIKFTYKLVKNSNISNIGGLLRNYLEEGFVLEEQIALISTFVGKQITEFDLC